MRTTSKKYPKYPKCSDLCFHFGASCLRFSWASAFYSRPVFRNLWEGGEPLDRFWPPLGHPRSNFVDLVAPTFKDSRATDGTNHTFKNQTKIQKHFTDNKSKQIFVDFCCLTKPHKSKAPGLKEMESAELPKG